ncbi:FAA hydrolase family protein [bacterium]|nr:MAG: FAA hydrolase family protein [bacterium]
MEYVVRPPLPVTLPIQGLQARFPARRVYCVGQNYADHVREMGGDPGRQPPFFFAKPTDALNISGEFPYPPASDDVHFEVELVVALASGGTDIASEAALDCVYGYGVGLDMTRRDLQTKAKKEGRPWEAAKAFDCSAPVGLLMPASEVGHPSEGAIWLDLNGERKQSGRLADLIWSVPEIIATLSSLFRLEPGDLIFTGTPAGVGPVAAGDFIRAGIDGLGELEVKVGKRETG